jgi:polar amino acid transport system permease protein
MSFADILQELSRGALYTLAVTLSCSATGLAMGLAVAGLRRLQQPTLTALLDLLTYGLRAVPVLVLLFLVYFGLPAIGIRVPPLAAMVLSLGLIAGAYLAEVFRGALESVDSTEILAAQAMGLSRMQVFVSIELPQMLRFAVPGMVNEFTAVLKYSPFAYTVGIPEMTKRAMNLTATNLHGVAVYLAVGVLYFALYRLLLAGVELIERRCRVPGIDMGVTLGRGH